jgi:hypothetical protein
MSLALALSINNRQLIKTIFDIDRSLNEGTTDKIRKYHSDYNNNPPDEVSFIPAIVSTSGRLHSEFIRLLFLQTHREPRTVDSSTSTARRSLSKLKVKVGSTLAKASGMCVNLNIDGSPITSRTHTHPSHSQTSRLLTSSLSLGVPVPRETQCM